MKSLIVRFVREEAGQDLIEYAMLATLIALVGGATAASSAPTSADCCTPWAQGRPVVGHRQRRKHLG